MPEEALTVLIAVATAAILSQGAKILIAKSKGHKIHFADFFVTGGMPSAHTAISTALTLSILFVQGITIPFLIAVTFTAIVIRDALGVRRTAGEEGKVLNQLIRKTKLKVNPLHYSVGHTPIEVATGIIIGTISATVIVFL